jgi:uncharacterized protein (TIGR00255 family)
MTGFGSATCEVGGFSLAVEVRSVNGRGLRLSLRLDDALSTAENEAGLRKMVADSVSRGRVTLTARLDPPTSEAAVRVDHGRAESYLEAARELAGRHGLQTGITAADLLAMPGVVGSPDPSREDPEELSGKLLSCAGEALEGLLESRAREGADLVEAMTARVRGIAAAADALMEGQEERVQRRFQALRERVARLLESPPEDQSRLYQELALLADRVDVTEEHERLRSHVSAALDVLESGGAGGRKLGFILQEMHRELNTMGSKVDDSEAQMQVVRMKNDLAALREQVANLE